MPANFESTIEIAAAVGQGRGENLALLFQELLTAVVRLRAGRQDVVSAEKFRGQVLHAIKFADQQAKTQGYTEDDIRLAVFAIVAFLDETILNLRQPVFKDWVRKPLQEELFGRHVAGETFFENLQQLLGRRDTPELADLLEVYYLCLLLGYLGRYSISSKAELRATMELTDDKIRRIRKMGPELSPNWRLPEEGGGPARSDPWFRRLVVATVASGALSLALFIAYQLTLRSGVAALREIAAGAAR
ncbi:MAG: DotU family type IV/VI secretion system protein [Bryobacteraceae bacterium]|nr:DotU family type IV/VI secretion system protein [Bryobacteraceae bacterium]